MTIAPAPKIDSLYEIRIHGRGGQGAQTAAQILAEAALIEGYYIQAFPEFGPERAGAPVEAFVRISPQPILIHNNVITPDAVLVLEESLIAAVDVSAGLKEAGFIIVNSGKNKKIIEKLISRPFNLQVFDASEIARYFLGKEIPNIILLGVYARVTGRIKMASLETVIKEKFQNRWGPELTEKNLVAMKVAYNESS